MLSRSQEKLLRKLRTKKHRWQERRFIAEGRKVVKELMDERLHPEFLLMEKGSDWEGPNRIEVEADAFRTWSSLEQADEVLGVFPFPELTTGLSEVVVVADRISDPGNLGTIIRTCDWFGINTVLFTTGTVDVFNAKTVQSTMGSIARVKVEYLEEQEIFELLKKDYRLLCADMEGEPITNISIEGKIALVMGSESHGPSDFWKENAHKITIPRKANSKVESLNVATATAVILGRLCLS